MLNWIISQSMRMRTVMMALALILLVGGVVQIRTMPLDLVPEFSPLSLEVHTEALGLSSTEVESLITVPLEADLLNGVPWLKSIESESITSLSAIEMFFAPGTDLMQARQMVQERLTQAHALPNVSNPPVMLQPVSSSSRVMNIGLSSKTVSLIDMSVQARWNIVPRLVGVSGVANVSVWGLRNKQIHVKVDPATLHKNNITLDQIVKTAGESVWASPLTYLNSSTPGSGGFIDTPNQRLGVRHISPTATPESFSQVPVFGTSIPLYRVANVIEANQPLIGDAVFKDGSGLLLAIDKFPGANTIEVTRGVEAALQELSPGMKGIEVDSHIYRPAGFIERAADNLGRSFAVAYVLMIIALAVFLANWRATLIAAVVIPISGFSAIWALNAWGAETNMMMMAGLALAIAVIVGDAILNIDIIARRLAEAGSNGKREADFGIIVKAAGEAISPLLYATAIILLVAVPLLFMQGTMAPFFQPLIWAYTAAVLTSLAVALLLTPAFCLILMSSTTMPERSYSTLMEKLTGLANALVNATGAKLLPTVVLSVVGLGVGLFVWTQSEHAYLPIFNETDIVVELDAPAGTSLPAMNRISQNLIKEILAIKGVRNAAAQVGRAVFSAEVSDVDSAEIWVSIDLEAQYDETLSEIQAVASAHPNIEAEVTSFLSKRMLETLTGDDETISVRVFGHDNAILKSKAEEIRTLLAKIDGIANPQVEAHAEKATIEVMVDLDRARQYGLKPGDVRRAASTLVQGITVGALFEDQKVFDVVVVGSDNIHSDIDDISNLLIDSVTGVQVRLGDVADVTTVSTPSVILRQGVSRRIDIVADISGRDIGAVSREVARRIKDVSFPFEYHAHVLGEYFEQKAAMSSLLSHFIAVALIIFLLLQAAYGSWKLALLSTAGIPIALLGGFLVVLASGSYFSLGSMVGLGIVLTFSVRSGLTLIRSFQLQQLQGKAFGAPLVRSVMAQRLPQVLISALVLAALSLPFAVVGNIAGLEILHSAALVMLGGLVSALVLVLCCIPAVYLRFGADAGQDTLGLLDLQSRSAASRPNQPGLTS
ncbi:efflux RND transporter permease subunit [Reinekea sp.]|jgi:Cu/Ag efflux pump CusA|uniref:efflux RND transporter permease subunit n=1 Tax=Reinekea sp. TaxID=1970455 RepID=UPI002A7EFD82|nr:efflux RND transporter permease subunit [Reinekea sp.]